jgi:isoquinoline 1-oxidoreductase
MLYGKVLRPPSYGATLESVDLSAVEGMKDVVTVREGGFVGFAAPSTFRATEALEAAEKTASWKTSPPPSSNTTIHEFLRNRAQKARSRSEGRGSVEQAFAKASRTLSEAYTLAYVQHAPMEPRAAVAEWNGNRLTVWAGCDGPYRARRDLAQEFGIPDEQVRVIIPDMGGGFGGKHTADAALEAARLAQAARRPVSVRWTRAEEFTWAYCRPAAVIECRAGLEDGSIVAWEFSNINGGGAAIETPYSIPNTRISSIRSDSPLPQGAYRCLGATGSNFARESFMDELAAAAGADALAFRLAHLENRRLRTVLEVAAEQFGWSERRSRVTPDLGVGLACGTEKNSCVAACAEVSVDRRNGSIRVREVCEVFECGPILNPANLTSQVQGCIIMGLGGALSEEIRFESGKIRNANFAGYRVPRFSDVPKIDVHLINNTAIPPAGGGETPIIAVAPAVGNAVFAATGVRLRSMPMRGEPI